MKRPRRVRQPPPLPDHTERWRRKAIAIHVNTTATPETIEQGREILRAMIYELAECELTVGGSLSDNIELPLRSIAGLLDRMNPALGLQNGGQP